MADSFLEEIRRQLQPLLRELDRHKAASDDSEEDPQARFEREIAVAGDIVQNAFSPALESLAAVLPGTSVSKHCSRDEGTFDCCCHCTLPGGGVLELHVAKQHDAPSGELFLSSVLKLDTKRARCQSRSITLEAAGDGSLLAWAQGEVLESAKEYLQSQIRGL